MLTDWKYILGAIRQADGGVANVRLCRGGCLLSRNEFGELGRIHSLISRRHIRD